MARRIESDSDCSTESPRFRDMDELNRCVSGQHRVVAFPRCAIGDNDDLGRFGDPFQGDAHAIESLLEHLRGVAIGDDHRNAGAPCVALDLWWAAPRHRGQAIRQYDRAVKRREAQPLAKVISPHATDRLYGATDPGASAVLELFSRERRHTRYASSSCNWQCGTAGLEICSACSANMAHQTL